MSDLNSLLHWAIENTPAAQGDGGSGSGNAAPANAQGMQLTFKPAAPGQQPKASTLAAFHPDDPQHDVGLAPPTSEQPKQESKLSTEMLDLIMGKPDSVTMKEKMAIASNTAADVDERVQALDDFEMLIELIDNANNMPVLKLWQPLLALVNDPNDDIARHALWVAGTAIQNNLKGQAAFYIFGGLPLVLDKLYPLSGSSPAGTRAKAVYALSSALKHWPLATVALGAQDNRGYSVLRAGVADDDLVIRRKMCFMLGTLVNQARDAFEGDEMPTEVRNMIEEQAKTSGAKAGSEGDELLLALQREGVFEAAVDALARDPRIDPLDAEYEENAIRALVRAAEFGALSDEEKEQLKAVWGEWTPIGRAHRGIEGADVEAIDKVLA